MKNSLLIICFLLSSALFAQVPGAKHVVVIGVDGMSPEGIHNANTPNINRLVQQGASTFMAKAVLPTSSSPNWASMFMGAGPEQHGITSNSWQPDKQSKGLACTGKDGEGNDSEMWPSIYSLLHQQKPNAKIACFHDWRDYGRLVEPGVCDIKKGSSLLDIAFHKGHKKAVKRATKYIEANKPEFTFIHLDHVDHAGHKHGHGTREYYDAVAYADVLIGRVLHSLSQAGIANETIVLVTSDHGGIGKGHGGESPQEVNIPWIIKGPNVEAGKVIDAEVKTYDTAATLAHIFGLTRPDCWIAEPVMAAFQKKRKFNKSLPAVDKKSSRKLEDQ